MKEGDIISLTESRFIAGRSSASCLQRPYIERNRCSHYSEEEFYKKTLTGKVRVEGVGTIGFEPMTSSM